jgi:hypothetical protein
VGLMEYPSQDDPRLARAAAIVAAAVGDEVGAQWSQPGPLAPARRHRRRGHEPRCRPVASSNEFVNFCKKKRKAFVNFLF